MSRDEFVRAIRGRLDEIEEQLKALALLTAERDTLRQTLAHYNRTARAVATVELPPLDVGQTEILPLGEDSAAEASSRPYNVSVPILDLLRKEPGLTGPQVADRLEGKIETTRRDPRRAISARIFELLNKEKALVRDEAGRLYVVGSLTVGPMNGKHSSAK